jgi:predicted metal-dependent hydrolase
MAVVAVIMVAAAVTILSLALEELLELVVLQVDGLQELQMLELQLLTEMLEQQVLEPADILIMEKVAVVAMGVLVDIENQLVSE